MDTRKAGGSPDDGSTGKLLGSAMLKLQLGVGCAALLLLGFWLTPRSLPTSLSTPQERAAPLLDEQVHGRAAADMSRSVREVVRITADYSVTFAVDQPAYRAVRSDFDWATPPEAIGQAFGVRVSESRLLTHLDALRSPTAVEGWSADGAPFTATVVAFEAATGLLLLETPPARLAPAPLSPTTAAGGALLVGAAQSGQSPFAAPTFVEKAEKGHYLLSAHLPPGLPLFDLEGRLVALVGGGRAGIAFPAAAAAERLAARAGTNQRSFGLSLQERTGLLEKAFGDRGVLVSDVVLGGPADRAGLRPADLLLTVGADDVGTVEDAMRALDAAHNGGAPIGVTVRRISERGPRALEMSPVAAIVIAALARTERAADHALIAGALFEEAALAAAGVPSATKLVEVNGVVVESSADVRRALRRRPTPAVLVLRDGRGRFVSAIEVAR